MGFSRHANGAIHTRDDVKLCRRLAFPALTVCSVDGVCSSSCLCVALLPVAFLAIFIGVLCTTVHPMALFFGVPTSYQVAFWCLLVLCFVAPWVAYTYWFWNPESDSTLRARYQAFLREIPGGTPRHIQT